MAVACKASKEETQRKKQGLPLTRSGLVLLGNHFPGTFCSHSCSCCWYCDSDALQSFQAVFLVNRYLCIGSQALVLLSLMKLLSDYVSTCEEKVWWISDKGSLMPIAQPGGLISCWIILSHARGHKWKGWAHGNKDLVWLQLEQQPFY